MAEEERHDWTEPLKRRNLLAARRRRLLGIMQCRVPLERMLVVARLREGAKAEEVAGYHRELFEGASECHPREQVSGLLLLSSSHVLHVVEACCSTMYFLIRALTSLQNEGPGALLQGIKVLVVAHSIPRRLFPEWNVAVVQSPVTHPEDSTQSQPIEEVVAECLTFLVSAAEYVLKSTEVKVPVLPRVPPLHTAAVQSISSPAPTSGRSLFHRTTVRPAVTLCALSVLSCSSQQGLLASCVKLKNVKVL